VKAFAAPLEKVDKITVVSTGGDSVGMNKVTNDLAKMAAQIPTLFETLSGMQMSELLSKVRTIGDGKAGDGKAGDGKAGDGKAGDGKAGDGKAKSAGQGN